MVAANKPTTVDVSSASSASAGSAPLGLPDVASLMWTENLAREHGFEAARVEGVLPAALRGTLYRNGPGQFAQFGKRYSHPFEADGAATAIRFADGKATAAARVHASAGLVDERAAGKTLYGLSASWPRRMLEGFRGKRKNTANTSVMVWQDRVFALMEAARPTELDPADLSVIGETDLGAIGAMFSAHPHRVASRKAIYNFGLEYGRKTKLHLYEMPDAGAVRHLAAIDLPGAPMLHDFIATDSHLVFFLSPVRVDIPRMMLALGGFEKLWKWKPELGTEILCVPIDRPTDVLRFTTGAFYQWHFANAFNRANEIVIDYVRYPNFDSFYEIGKIAAGGSPSALTEGRLHRATIDLAAKTLRSEQLSDRGLEFPTVAPGHEGTDAPITYAAFDDLRAIGSIDARGQVTSHTLAADERATEPLFADGHLLVLCHTRSAAYVGIYDAARIPDGPVAKVWLDHTVPITFHGTFHRR